MTLMDQKSPNTSSATIADVLSAVKEIKNDISSNYATKADVMSAVKEIRNYIIRNYATKTDLRSAVKDINSNLNKNYVNKKEFEKRFDTVDKDIQILKKSVLNIENTIKIYSDMYDVNKISSEKLAWRVKTLERHAGIKPPQDCLISGV